MVMTTTTMSFFKKAPKYQSKKYATNPCNPKEENKKKRTTKKKKKQETSPTLLAHKLDRSKENGMEI